MRCTPHCTLCSRLELGGISTISVGRRKIPNLAALAESETELEALGTFPARGGDTLGTRMEDGDSHALSASFNNSALILEAITSTT